MNNNMAGIPTAPSNTADTVRRPKTILLAIHRDDAGGVVITPVGVEGETLATGELILTQKAMGYVLHHDFLKRRVEVMKAFHVLLDLFETGTYRWSHHSFKEYCQRLFGEREVPETTLMMAKAELAKAGNGFGNH